MIFIFMGQFRPFTTNFLISTFLYLFDNSSVAAGIAQSVQRLATGWTVRGSNPGGGQDFPYPSIPVPGAHPASYTMCTGSYQGVKRPGRGADHPSPSSAEVKERVELCICSISGPSWPVLGWTVLDFLLHVVFLLYKLTLPNVAA